MKTLQLVFLALFISSCTNETSKAQDIKAIRRILNTQQRAWSNHNVKEFMKGYWESDSLKFFGGSGITAGWQNTLDNYKKRYPTSATMGELEFTLRDISQINRDAYWVMGEYHLTRKIGDAHGTFMIIFKRINGKWKIIADSSC